jgi:uncharacterized protein HemX
MQTETTPTKSKFSAVTALLIVFLLAAIGLGVWGYMLTNDTNATRADEAALQAKYETLTNDKKTLDGNLVTAKANLEQAKADLEQAKKDLEKAKKDLETEQANLAKAQESKSALQANVDKAVKYLKVAIAYWVEAADPEEMRQLIKDTEDADLID